eukprot:gene3345-2327_t
MKVYPELKGKSDSKAKTIKPVPNTVHQPHSIYKSAHQETIQYIHRLQSKLCMVVTYAILANQLNNSQPYQVYHLMQNPCQNPQLSSTNSGLTNSFPFIKCTFSITHAHYCANYPYTHKVNVNVEVYNHTRKPTKTRGLQPVTRKIQSIYRSLTPTRNTIRAHLHTALIFIRINTLQQIMQNPHLPPTTTNSKLTIYANRITPIHTEQHYTTPNHLSSTPLEAHRISRLKPVHNQSSNTRKHNSCAETCFLRFILYQPRAITSSFTHLQPKVLQVHKTTITQSNHTDFPRTSEMGFTPQITPINNHTSPEHHTFHTRNLQQPPNPPQQHKKPPTLPTKSHTRAAWTALLQEQNQTQQNHKQTQNANPGSANHTSKTGHPESQLAYQITHPNLPNPRHKTTRNPHDNPQQLTQTPPPAAAQIKPTKPWETSSERKSRRSYQHLRSAHAESPYTYQITCRKNFTKPKLINKELGKYSYSNLHQQAFPQMKNPRNSSMQPPALLYPKQPTTPVATTATKHLTYNTLTAPTEFTITENRSHAANHDI